MVPPFNFVQYAVVEQLVIMNLHDNALLVTLLPQALVFSRRLWQAFLNSARVATAPGLLYERVLQHWGGSSDQAEDETLVQLRRRLLLFMEMNARAVELR